MNGLRQRACALSVFDSPDFQVYDANGAQQASRCAVASRPPTPFTPEIRDDFVWIAAAATTTAMAAAPGRVGMRTSSASPVAPEHITVGSPDLPRGSGETWTGAAGRWLCNTGRWAIAKVMRWPTSFGNEVLFAVGWRERFTSIDDAQRLLLGVAPDPNAIEALTGLGIRTVINLRAEDAGPLAAYTRVGIRQVWLPTYDGQTPSWEQIAAGIEAMRAGLGRGEAVLVHCQAGIGRSATLVVAYLVAEGMEPEAAQAHVRAKRPAISRNLAELEVVQRARCLRLS